VRVLEFKRPVFKRGINYTVRLGTKWANVRVGREIKIANTKKTAYICYVTRCLLLMLVRMQEILRNEHDPSCRTFTGLVRELQRVYGKRRVDPISEVVCLGFTVHEGAHLK